MNEKKIFNKVTVFLSFLFTKRRKLRTFGSEKEIKRIYMKIHSTENLMIEITSSYGYFAISRGYLKHERAQIWNV